MKRLNRAVWIAVLTGVVVFGATPANAEGWLTNPFSKKKATSKTSPAAYRGSKSNSKPWLPKMKLPALPKMSLSKLPGVGAKQANQPTITQKATAGVKKAYAKTKAMITKPFQKKPVAAPRSQFALGYGGRKAAPKKQSFFSWLLPFGEKKPREIHTVNDFLSQERPDF